MSRRLPPLVALKAFEAVVRLGGMRKAAAELGVDHTAVGRHVRNLEAVLGLRLLETDSRGSLPTAEGRRLADQSAIAFDLIADVTESLSPARRNGELRIWCVPGLAVRWLMPRLSEVQALVPDREIVLRPTDQAPDLIRGEADLEIRFKARPAPGIKTEDIISPRFFPVASPAFLKTRPPVGTLADLTTLPLIHEDTREQWRVWLQSAGLNPVPPLDGPRLWYANVAIEAALMGQGAALVNRLQVAPELADGTLLELLHTHIEIGAYTVQAAADRWSEPVLVKLRRWLKTELELCVREDLQV